MTSQPCCYTTDHQHSKVIMSAFAEGCKGRIVPPAQLLDGPAAMYGILRGTGEILKQCEWVQRDYYYLDHGYFKAGHYNGFYRVTKNGRQADLPDEREYRYPDDRFRKLGLPLAGWRKSGRHIVVIPLTGAVANFYGINPDQWLRTVTTELSRHTSRPIVVKPKGDGDIRDSLKDCWALVTHSSNSAVDAIADGVPSVVLGESACEAVSWTFEDLEKPWWPERECWVNALAYHQFTLDEMRNGTAWKILNDRID